MNMTLRLICDGGKSFRADFWSQNLLAFSCNHSTSKHIDAKPQKMSSSECDVFHWIWSACFASRALFRAATTRMVLSVSSIVIFSQFAILDKVPSLFTTIGPKASSLTVSEGPKVTCFASSFAGGAMRSGVALGICWSSFILVIASDGAISNSNEFCFRSRPEYQISEIGRAHV